MTEPPAEPERRPASARSSNARSLLALRARLGHSLADLTAGGAWTYQLTPAIRRSLRWFWFDGLFAAACDTAPAAYLSLFVLALGGTRGQIGLTSSLSSLSAALFLMPSAMLVERWGHHKRIVVTASLVSRVSLLLMALLPWFLHGSPAIAALIALAVVYGTFANISVPAWTPLTAHLVPLQWRGRYFSSRNIAMVVSAMVATYAFGWLITLLPVPHGYQIALCCAFVIGLASSFSFSRIEEDPSAMPREGAVRGPRQPLFRGLGAQLREHPDFAAFLAVSMAFNLAVGIGGPFFNAYLVEGLGATASTVGFLTVLNSLAAMPGHRLFGRLCDRWGPRKVMLLTGLLIPVTPLIWIMATQPWHVIPANVIGGFVWAGYGISSFTLQLSLIPKEHMPRWSGLILTAALLMAAAGAALGGVLAQQFGYKLVFVLTMIGRLGSGVLFWRLVKEPPRPAAA